jgi:H+-translocating NAD(P) transhydrogenase subunit alpha
MMIRPPCLTVCLLFLLSIISVCAFAQVGQPIKQVDTVAQDAPTHQPAVVPATSSRAQVLIGSLTVFVLAVFVGFEIIAKVPPTLHTPLMSGSNAISGITVLGAIIAAGNGSGGFAAFLGFIAIVLAMINVVGGFAVTRRMLLMFKKR